MSKAYEVDIKKLSVLLLPTFLRKSKMVAWLHSLVTPLVSLHYSFIQKRNDDLYRLRHNGQVCYLRAVLNDSFDDLRRIKISDGNRYKRQYIYNRGEVKAMYLGKTYLYERSDYSDTGLDFIVEVPLEVLRKNEIEAVIDFYRLAGKRYKIVKI